MENLSSFIILVVVAFSLLCSGIEIDFSSGGYSLKKEERNGKEKY